jgi:hypothetical protein
MPPRKTTRRRRASEPSWDDIGRQVGKKFEKYEKDFDSEKCGSWFKWKWHSHDHGGGFGRFLFICGLFLAWHSLGMFTGLPWYVIALIIIGFSMMKF